jgi:hypothetical protein
MVRILRLIGAFCALLVLVGFRGILRSAWLLCCAVVTFAILLGVGFAVLFVRPRKDDDELAEATDDTAITQRQEEDEDDDKERRWFIDLGPEEQARMIARVAAQQPCFPDPIFQRRKLWPRL